MTAEVGALSKRGGASSSRAAATAAVLLLTTAADVVASAASAAYVSGSYYFRRQHQQHQHRLLVLGQQGTNTNTSTNRMRYFSNCRYYNCWPSTTTTTTATFHSKRYLWGAARRSSSSILRRSSSIHSNSNNVDDDDDDDDGADAVLSKGKEGYHLLPRLYVGGGDDMPVVVKKTVSSFSQLQSQSPLQSPSLPLRLLDVGASIPLSSDQSHYLTKVLRLFKKKKNKKKRRREQQQGDSADSADSTSSSSDSDASGDETLLEEHHNNFPLVRLFDNGVSGEWLAEVSCVVGGDDEDGRGSSGRRKSSSGGSQKQQQAIAHCLKRLRSVKPDSAATLSSSLSSYHPWLCVSVPNKKDRLRYMIEKSTELSVANFVLLQSDYSSSTTGSSGSSLSIDKLHSYVVEAAEQSERLSLPQFVRFVSRDDDDNDDDDNDDDNSLSNPLYDFSSTRSSASSTTRLMDLLQMVSEELKEEDAAEDDGGNNANNNVRLLVCRERNHHNTIPVLHALEQICNNYNNDHNDNGNEEVAESPTMQILFVVGPEGGFSPEEEKFMDEIQRQQEEKEKEKEQGSSSRSGGGILYNVSLGPTVLRTETAALAALSAYTLFMDNI